MRRLYPIYQMMKGEPIMLWTVLAVLLVLWLVGVVALPTAGALIHILLVVAAIVLVYQLISGRRTV